MKRRYRKKDGSALKWIEHSINNRRAQFFKRAQLFGIASTFCARISAIAAAPAAGPVQNINKAAAVAQTVIDMHLALISASAPK